MSGKTGITGVVVPMITPLTERGEIDEIGVGNLVDLLVAAGVDALFPLGSSGEFVSLNQRKQTALLRAVVRCAAGRVPVCAGVSSSCLEEVIEHATVAAELGADAAAMLTPFYFRTSQPELVRFFITIAERSPIPIIPYNIPFRTNNSLDPETVEILSRHPNVIGIKDTVSDMARTLDILGRVREQKHFSYLHGNELLAIPSLLFGAKGCVPSLANFAPEVMVEVCRAVEERDMNRLPDLQAHIQRLMRVFSLLESRPQESTNLRLQAIKVVLELKGICRSYMAQLDTRPSGESMERVRKFMLAEHLSTAAAELVK